MVTPGLGAPSSPPRPPFSWRRGLVHAALVLAVIVVAGAVLAGAGLVEDPQRFGEGVGRFAVAALIVAWGVSYLAQTGRRRAAWALALGTTALVAALIAYAFLSLEGGARLAPAERADLALVNADDERWLEHPALGFAVRHPGPSFEPAPDVSAALAASDAEEGMATWGYVDRTTGEALAVMAVKGVESRKELDGFLRGFRESLGRAGATVQREEVAWTADRREIRLDLALDESGTRVSIRGLGAAALGPDRAPFLIAVLATTDDPARAATLVESLRLR